MGAIGLPEQPDVELNAKATIPLPSSPKSDVVEDLQSSGFFPSNFDGNWELAAERVENGRKLLDRIRGVMSDLAALEQQYAAGLCKIAAKLQVPSTELGGTTDHAIKAIQSELVTRADHCREYATAISHDLVKGTLDSTLQNHRTVYDQIYRDGVSLTAAVRDALGSCVEAADRYDSTCRNALKFCIEAQCSELSAPAVRSKFNNQALTKCLAAEKAEEEYDQTVEVLKKRGITRRKQENMMLTALEDMDGKRIECLKDGLRKYCIFRTAQLRNAQYDLSRISEALEGVDGKADMAQFVAKFKVSSDEIKSPDQIPFSHWPELCTLLQGPPFDSMSRESIAISTVDDMAKRYIGPQGQAAAQAATTAAKTFMRRASLNSVFQLASSHLKVIGAAMATTGIPDRDAQLTLTAGDGVETISHKEMADLLSGEPGIAWMHRYLGGRSYRPPALETMREDHERLIAAIWEGDFELLFLEYGQQMAGNFNERFASCLDRQLVGAIMTQRLCSDQITLKSLNSLIALAKICECLLDWGSSHNDFWTGRLVMMVSQFVHASVTQDVDLNDQLQVWHWPATAEEATDMSHPPPLERGKPVVTKYLYRCLYAHPLWNRVSFWEEALMLTLSESYQKKILEKIWKHRSELKGDHSLLEKEQADFSAANPCMKVLLCFSQCMTRYGIMEAQASDMIVKACRKVGIPEEKIETLIISANQETTSSSEPDLQSFVTT